jgi:hypothetical protein
MEAAIGIMIISGLVFCFLLWAEIIRLGGKKIKEDDF